MKNKSFKRRQQVGYSDSIIKKKSHKLGINGIGKENRRWWGKEKVSVMDERVSGGVIPHEVCLMLQPAVDKERKGRQSGRGYIRSHTSYVHQRVWGTPKHTHTSTKDISSYLKRHLKNCTLNSWCTLWIKHACAPQTCHALQHLQCTHMHNVLYRMSMCPPYHSTMIYDHTIHECSEHNRPHARLRQTTHTMYIFKSKKWKPVCYHCNCGQYDEC